MEFADDSFGVVLADSGRQSACFRISDSGKQWDQIRIYDSVFFVYEHLFNSFRPHSLSLPTANDIYFVPGYGDRSYVSHDSGFTWQYYEGTHNPAGARIFADGSGLLAGRDTIIYLYETTDSCQTWTKLWREQSPIIDIHDFLCIDNRELWACGKGGILHTTDKGFHWSQFDAGLSSEDWASSPQIASANSSRLYALMNKNERYDFVESTDAGQSWRIDSTLGGSRFYRMYSPSPNILWAFVGHSDTVNDDDLRSVYQRRNFADTLYYSSNDGATWAKDLTFIGDTLTEMCWPDERHGYIVAWRDSTLHVYRFVPNTESIREREPQISVAQMYPNPAMDILNVRTDQATRLIILDLLGRRLRDIPLGSANELHVDISGFPEGSYHVLLVAQDGSVRNAGVFCVIRQ